MEIYKCGTEVTLKDVNVNGRILAVEISFEAISYKVSYFDGLKRTVEWFNEDEFKTDVKQIKIGYIV